MTQDPFFLSLLEPPPTAAPSSTLFPCHITPGLMVFVCDGLRRPPKAPKATSPAGGWTTCSWSMLLTEPPSWKRIWTPQTLLTGSSSLELQSRFADMWISFSSVFRNVVQPHSRRRRICSTKYKFTCFVKNVIRCMF